MTKPSRLLDYVFDSGPIFVAKHGVVCMVDAHYPESDERRYVPSATCVPYNAAEAAQASAEDIAFMMNGYCTSLLLCGRIVEDGLTSELRREIETLIAADEVHMYRNSR
jgi:hypothetical protein